MPKTRQQRLAEERAGHPPSPPQHLEDKARASRRTRAKTPSDNELTASAPDVTPSAPERTPSTSRLAGPVVPATQSAMPGEPQALLRIWVDIDPEDSGRPAGDAILQETIPSSRVPELVAFLKAICNQEKNKVPESSSKLSLDQLTPRQEKMDATLSENQTRSRPPKAKKRAFRRNPLHATSSIFESQPATTSLDTTTAGDIFSPQAGPPETAPETPQRSKWSIGNIFQPSSIKKFWVLAHLPRSLKAPSRFFRRQIRLPVRHSQRSRLRQSQNLGARHQPPPKTQGRNNVGMTPRSSSQGNQPPPTKIKVTGSLGLERQAEQAAKLQQPLLKKKKSSPT